MAEELNETMVFIISLLSVIWAMLVISYFRFGLEAKMTMFLVFGIIIAYFAHELAHKISAMRSGYDLEFKLSKIGLLLLIILPVVSLGYFLVIIPLAAKHEKMKNIPFKDYAYKISTPGPMMNIILLIIFTVLFSDPYIRAMGLINAIYAFWNMLPGTDGENIYKANKALWASLIIILAVFSLANIFGITTNQFIVFFTNAFGILSMVIVVILVIIIVLGLLGIKATER